MPENNDLQNDLPLLLPDNPSSSRKETHETIRILKQATPDCARMLVEIATDPKVEPRLRCQAAEAVLDRVFGKANHPLDAAADGNGEVVRIEFQGVLEEWSK